MLVKVTFFCTLLLSFLLQAQDKVVRFAIGEWAPYTSSDPSERSIAEQVIVRAFATQGYQVQIDYHPWPRSIKLLSTELYDGSFPWAENRQRKESFIYSEPFLKQRVVFFSHTKSNFTWTEEINFQQYVIGATQGYHITNLLFELGIKPVIDADEKNNFIKLAKRRIDAYPAGLSRGKYLIEKELSHEQASQIKVGSKALAEGYLHVIFSKQNLERSNALKQIFNNGLRQLIDNGEYQKLVVESNRVNTSALQ